MKRGSNTRRFRIPTPTQKKPKTSPATTPAAVTPAAHDGGEASLLARLQPSDARPAAEPNAGFKTAALVAATPPSDEPPAPEEPARESPTNIASPAAPPAQDENATTTRLELQIVGLRYRDGRQFLQEGAAVKLRREANEHDANAIEAWIPGDLAPVHLHARSVMGDDIAGHSIDDLAEHLRAGAEMSFDERGMRWIEEHILAAFRQCPSPDQKGPVGQ